MQKKSKPTAALARCAREIKDSDEFLEHVASIAARYRREHALDKSSRGGARKALRSFAKHAEALTEWLREAQRPAVVSESRQALDAVGHALYGVQGQALAESQPVADWLRRAQRAAEELLADPKALPRKEAPRAPLIASEALRATFDYHKLKWSTALTKQRQSDAVRLLCAIAKSAGDAELTPELARAALRASSESRG